MMRSFQEVRIERVALAALAAALTAGQAWAASTVGFVLEMGGNNHSSSYKAGSRQLFTSGNTTDGQIFGAGSPVTWGVRLNASGTHGASFPINGVANFVFDVELRSGSAAGPLVSTAVFHSTINDGNNGDILAKAAFAFSFNLIGAGPGRVVDPQSGLPPPNFLGGHLCGGVDSSADKVKSATYPTGEPGKLVGMGAGYNAWKACCGSAKTTPGLGITGAIPAGTGLGAHLVICEGQISNLAQGTYVLKVTPAPGNNVLRSDVNLTTDQNSFAVAADATTGDEITFVIGNPLAGKATNPTPANNDFVTTNPVTLSWTAGANAVSHDVYFGTTNPPPLVSGAQAGTTYNAGNLANNTYFWRIDERNIDDVVTSGDLWTFTVEIINPAVATQWRSIRSHGLSGNYSIVLNQAASSGTDMTSEPRQGGIRKIQVDFDRNVSMFAPPAAVGSDANTYPAVSAGMIDPDTLEIDFGPGLPNGLCYTIDLAGLVFDDDYGLFLGGDTDCVIRGLQGDANPTAPGIVSLSDSLLVKARTGTSVSLSPWADVDSNGTIDHSDAMLAKSQIGNHVCP
jgi:hypothetical protein